MSYEEKFLEIEKELALEFQGHKEYDLELADVYERIGEKTKAKMVRRCGTELDFRLPEDFSASPKLYRANFCKDRLCSMCGWRRSKKIFAQVSKVMDKIESDYSFVFVSLTVENCSASELSDTIDRLMYGFKKMMLISDVKRAFKGYFKTLEITIHPEHPRKWEYHPHIHAIFAVNKSYFKSSSYIKHKDLVQYWRRVCGLDYDPTVYIEKIKPNVNEDGDIDLADAVCEVAKYSTKLSDVLQGSLSRQEETVDTMMRSLESRRLCSFGGVFKKAAMELKLDDMLDGDLVVTDGDKLRSDVGYILVTYEWRVGFGYQRTYVRRLEREEHKK